MKNSDLKLDKEVRLLLEQELGRDVPEPNSPEFQAFLEELQAERPDLFDEVMRGLHVNVVLPVEEQAQRAERRDNVRTAVQRTFFRRSQVDGQPVTAKRRIMMFALIAGALMLPAMYILGQMLPDRSVDATVEPPAVIEPDLQQPDSTPLRPQIEPPELAEPEEVSPPIRLPPPPRKVEAAVPPEPTPKPTPPAPTPAPAPRAAPAPQAPAPEAEPLPTTLSVYQEQEALPDRLQVFGTVEEEEAPSQLGIFSAEASLPASLSLEIETPLTRPTELGIAEEAQAPPDETVLFDLAQVQAEAAEQEGQNTQGQPVPGEPLAEGGAETETANDVAATIPETPDLFPIGTRIPAQLVTGISVAQGGSVPVVAKTTGDWCVEAACPEITWIGRATLDALERVQISLDQSLLGETLEPAKGLALAPDATLGLTAEIRDESPSLAEQLLGSSLGGVSDYVQALTQQQKVTVLQNGVALTETQLPEVDAFILGRVASLFSTPATSTGPTVRVAEVPATTSFVILYGVTGETQTQ